VNYKTAAVNNHCYGHVSCVY